MALYSCKCGLEKVRMQQRPPACMGCHKCGTTLRAGVHPRPRKPLPHVMRVSRLVEACTYCGRTKEQIPDGETLLIRAPKRKRT